jgi:hypothetical protein
MHDLMQLLRAAAASLALFAAGSTLAGCGGSGAAASGIGTPHASSPITKEQAVAFAKAVNLRAADLPDMRATTPEHERGTMPEDRQLARCDGGVDPYRRIAQIHSDAFTGVSEGELERIGSEVELMPTAALTAQNNGAVRSPRGLKCVAHLLAQEVAHERTGKARYGSVTISKLATPLPGVDETFQYRITTTITAGLRRIPLYIDLLGFVSGPAEVDVTAIGAPQPASTEAEQRLLSLLYSRAEAHKLA